MSFVLLSLVKGEWKFNKRVHKTLSATLNQKPDLGPLEFAFYAYENTHILSLSLYTIENFQYYIWLHLHRDTKHIVPTGPGPE